MDPWRAVLVGCGYIAPYHLAAWRELENVEVVAVCDLDENQARKRAAEFGVVQTFTDPTVAIATLEPSIVDIATPPATHPAIVEEAAAHGAHVLCQKPFAESLEQVDRMIAVCQQAGVRLMVNENLRWSRTYRELKRLIDEGTLGEPYYIQIVRDRLFLGQPLFPNQPFIKEMPRAILYEAVIHYVDCVRFLLGEIRSVHCQMQRINPRMRGEDFVVVNLDLADGRVGLIKADWCSRQPGDTLHESIRLCGTKGTASVSQENRLSLLLNDGRTIEQCDLGDNYPGGESFPLAHAHFIHGLETGQSFETDGQDNRRTLAAVFAGYESAEQRVVVQVESQVTAAE